MSGAFIVLNKSFKINDFIEIQGNKGKVIEITWHDTIIESETKEKIVIPNLLITSTIFKKVGKNKLTKVGEAEVYDLGGNVAEYFENGIYGYSAYDFYDANNSNMIVSKYVGFRVIKE